MLSRELRAALSLPLALTVAASVALALSLGMSGALFTTMLGLPFVIARVSADHPTTRALVQLGHRPLSIVLARFVGLVLALVLTLAAPLALAARDLDGGSVLTLAIGHGCVGLAVIGIGLFACSLTSTRAAATLATLVVTAGTWALDAARVPGSFAMPTAALRVFERGLVDAREVIPLVAGGIGLALASAMLLSRTAPIEARALRCAGVLLVTALACGGASQVRASVDLTRGQRATWPAPWVASLAQVGDRVELTLHMKRDDSRVDELEREVLTRLRRTVRVRVRFEPPASGPSAHLLTWRVGTRTQTSDALTADAAVPIILELAGVR